jgi:Flp pilus assembly protein TadG
VPRQHPVDRRGVAAVELAAVLLFFIAPLMIGVWEVGRLIQVQQIVSNSAREGARLAAQGFTINTSGSPTQIHVSTGTPNVHDVVYQYLLAAGLTNLTSADVTVTVKDASGNAFEPYTGVKNQPFTVTVTIPWDKVRWVNLGLVKPSTVTFTVSWQMLIDDAFTVNSTLPTI